MRKYVRAGLEALSSQGGDDVAAALMSRAQGVADQLSMLAAGFLEWSSEARANLLQEVRDLIARQVEEMGLATKDDLRALQDRIDRLEGAGATGPAAARSRARGPGATAAKAPSATRPPGAKSPRGKSSGAKRTVAKASGARRTVAKASGAKRAGAAKRPTKRSSTPR